MVKITNKKELKGYIEKHAADKITAKYTAKHLKITPKDPNNSTQHTKNKPNPTNKPKYQPTKKQITKKP
jgi:hypothetical protein